VRIIHTSDWHIGRRFEREPMEADQRAFLRWLALQVEEHGVDLVLVAGDVYDRALPSEDAVALLDEGLDALRAGGAIVAIIPGNHDSARRLGFGARRQAHGGVHVFADELGPPEPWVFEASGEAVAVVAVPFLDPLTAPPPLPGPDGIARARTHGNVLSDFLDAGRSSLRRFAGVPAVAVAHATVLGSVRSDSEKLLAIGGADAVDARIFDGFEYVALGHLHRPQRIGEDERMAYSGSPLPYSFSETHEKSVRLVEIAGGEVISVRRLPVPVGRPVATVEASLEQLLSDPSYERYAEHWLAARLTDETTQVQPMERLRRRFPHAVNVSYAAGTAGGSWAACQSLATGHGRGGAAGGRRATEDVVLAFLAELSGRPPRGWETELVLEAVASAAREAGT
jgi:DNA repair protein SbcD/Mre11